MAERAMLAVRNLRVTYGGAEALRGIDLDVHRGELVALIGANGAGKSTCLRAIAGLVRPVEGSIRLDGHELAGAPAHHIVARGISLVPEGRRLFGDQTVSDNLLLGAYRRWRAGAAKTLRDDADTYFARFPILRQRQHTSANTLSGGEQQMLAISRGLMARPALLLLDEPSLGLAPLLVAQIFEIITQLKAEGRTILLVEQMARRALHAADRAYVLEQGRVVLTGSGPELLAHSEIIRAYLGARGSRD
jgi:branched-chain amino acid transport system ATP-binding protein